MVLYRPFCLLMKDKEKERILLRLIRIANLYKDKVENKNFLFIFGNIKQPESIETIFNASNFLHLTGVSIVKNISNIKSTKHFYQSLLSNNVKIDDFSIEYINLTDKKLNRIVNLLNFSSSMKIVGIYNNSKYFLQCDKLIGDAAGCIGFIKYNKYYYPNTVMDEDINRLTEHPRQRVLVILQKNKDDKYYKTVSYLAKKIDLKSLSLSEEIKSKLKSELYS